MTKRRSRTHGLGFSAPRSSRTSRSAFLTVSIHSSRSRPGIMYASRRLSRNSGTVTKREGTRLRCMRSEEHTSELQSRQYLVCRLLLAKKNESNKDEYY